MRAFGYSLDAGYFHLIYTKGVVEIRLTEKMKVLNDKYFMAFEVSYITFVIIQLDPLIMVF